MRLNKLKLENFQGIRDALFNFDGRDADIYADNGAGKTTVYNAFTWLLFDKASTGEKGFSPKTRIAGDYLHNAIHGVTAELTDDDGAIITLRKEYKEVYTRKRGAATEEFTGHTTDYFVDSVPVAEKEYKATIDRLTGGEEAAKMLTMPNYFPEVMEWRKRRETLIKMCGDIPDGEIIKSTAGLEDLPGYLVKPGAGLTSYTVEEFTKIITERKTELNKELNGLPGRIDEARRAIPDTQGMTEEAITAQIAEAENTLAELQGKRMDIENNGGKNDLKARINEINADLLTRKYQHDTAEREKTDEQYKKVDGYKRSRQAKDDNLRQLKRDAEANENALTKTKELRATLWTEYQAAQKVKWDDASENCKMCGQALPADKVEQLKADFNEAKSKNLSAISEKVKAQASRDLIDELEKKAATYTEAISSAETEINELTEIISELNATPAETIPFAATAEYAALSAEIEQLRAAENGNAPEILSRLAPLDAAITETKQQIDTLRANKAKFDTVKAQNARIADLTSKQRQTAADYEKAQYASDLCDKFTVAKSARINEQFKTVSFRLFKPLVNGGIDPDCEVLVPDGIGNLIPYSSANNAARINAGLEIIGIIGRHYGRSLPCFVDNAESVCRLQQIDAQVIRLIVSEADKVLRVQTKER